MELLVVIALIFIIATFVFTAFTNYGNEQMFKATVVEVASAIKEARLKTLSAETDTQLGIHFESSALVVFEGVTYNAASPTNKIISLPNITINTTLTDVVFARLTGLPSANGTITLEDNRSNSTSVITITASGLVE